MRRAAFVLPLLTSAALAQLLVAAGELPRIERLFQSRDGVEALPSGTGDPPLPSQAPQSDIITAVVARLKGKTLTIHTPAELARPFARLRKRGSESALVT